MSILDRLNQVNDVPVYDCRDEAFRPYGIIHEGFDVKEAVEWMKANGPMPEKGNMYLPSVKGLEDLKLKKDLVTKIYGGMPVQMGLCDGYNTTYNGFEFHKGSEINIAVTGFMLVLAHVWQIRDCKIDVSDAKVFYVPEGTVLEMFETTLHLSPCRISDEGFKDIVVLPEGTNLPLTEEEKAALDRNDPWQKLLLARNKWVLSHPQREPLMKQGAWPGLTGENKELFY